MSKKYQKDLKLIVGIDDVQGGLDAQAPKASIGGRRGMAYYTSAGGVGRESADTDADSGTISFPSGSGTSTEYETVTKQVPTSYTIGGGGSAPTTADKLDSPTEWTGKVLTRLEGFYDCTTGTPINLNVALDECIPPTTEINCEDVCVNPVDDGTWQSGYYWYGCDGLYATAAQAGERCREIGVSNGYIPCGFNYINDNRWEQSFYTPFDGFTNCVALDAVIKNLCSQAQDPNQYPCNPEPTPEQLTTCPDEIYEPQCEEFPWDTCECYHIEKRGALKDGWDSEDMYREGVCAPLNQHFSYLENTYFRCDPADGYTSVDAFKKSQAAGNYTNSTLGECDEAAGYGPDGECIRYKIYDSQGSVHGYVLRRYCAVYPSGTYCGIDDTFTICDVDPEQCAPPNEPDDYVSGYWFGAQSNGDANQTPKHTTLSEAVAYTIDTTFPAGYSFVSLDGYYVQSCFTGYCNYRVSYSYQDAESNTYSTTEELYIGFECGSSTEDYCNPDYSTPEDCEPLELTQAEDCTPPQDATNPQGMMWSSDGAVDYTWNPETGKFEANTLDPDIYTEGANSKLDPNQLNLCDQYGTSTDIGTTSDGGLVITYDPATNGGITYIVRGADGKITAAGDVGRDAYLDPNNPLNWQ